MRLNLMIEGQEDVGWADWEALARTTEAGGFEGLFRSDHYLTGGQDRSRGSLDAWATLAGLAVTTERIKLGTMVSPVTFRHPSVLSKMVTTVDHISGGRVELGIGAGWMEAEHEAYGFDFPSTGKRFEILTEQIEIIVRQWSEGSFNFSGKHYRLRNSEALPKPIQTPRPNLIVGGAGNKQSAALAAKWADEYNTVFPTVDEAAQRRAHVAKAWEAADRDPSTLVFSIMTGCIVGADDAEVRRRSETVMERTGSSDDVDRWIRETKNRWIIGTVDEAIEQIERFEEAGVERIMLQHLAHGDVEMVELIGAEIVPKVG
jgi:F420-dependent oxidoreductase-like protein